RQRLLEILLRLAGEADDQIGADAHVRFYAAQFFNDAEKPFARVTAMHQLQHAVAPALHRDMRALAQLRQPRVGFDEVVAVTFRMRRSEPDAFKAFDLMDGFEQLNERGFLTGGWKVVGTGRRECLPYIPAPAITRHDLPEERDLLHAARYEFAAFGDDVGNRATPFLATRVGHDAEGAILVAALHDAHERGHGFLRAAVQQMFANRRFAPLLRRDVHNLVAPSGHEVVEIFRRAMKFLRADDEVDVGQLIDQLASAALRHATHETEHDVRPF